MSEPNRLSIQASEPPGEEIRRAALSAIDDAIACLQTNEPADKEVHEARKRLKEVRALVRLTGDGLSNDARSLRIALRDAGRHLAAARDAEALIESFDKLRDRFRSEWGARRYGKIRRVLVRQKARATPPDIENVIASLRAISEEIGHWQTQEESFGLLSDGLRSTYRQTRRIMRAALADRTPEAFHEWRKRVKEHRYHTEVIELAWPAVLGPQAEALHQLSCILGDHHDLVVLRVAYQRDPEAFASRRLLRGFDRCVDVRLRELESEAEPIGRRIFLEKSRQWLRRMEAYWSLWRT